MNRTAIGIDLGTTFSLAAVMTHDGPRVLPNALGELLTPSAVSVAPDGTLLVGAPALSHAVLHPERTALTFKRDMGTDRVWNLGHLKLRPEELSAAVLTSVKHDAEAALQAEIAEAVVTVPAYFGELQRRATRDACELAGIPVERIINEPTAAALAYGLHERHREFRAVVLDLGGGTFDVTVLEMMEGVIEVQASSGDTRLGGEDFLDALVQHCARALGLPQDFAGDRELLARLRASCERAKKSLSHQEHAVVLLRGAGASTHAAASEVRITRQEAEALWAPLLARFDQPIRRALRDARLRASEVDEVLLVGGATRMPCFQALAAQLFGRKPLASLPPDEAVALGAAVQAALKLNDAAVQDVVVTDIAPFSLGVSVAELEGNRLVDGIFSPILERGTVLPASRVGRYSTMQSSQTSIVLQIYQGEHAVCSKNQKLGECAVHGIPRGPAGTEAVEVRFTYDLNGILDVDATVVATGRTTSITIERAPGRLNPKQLAAAKQAMQSLKFHPREALPNVTALARAEALYAELLGAERELLGQALSHFRLILESQDPKRIEPARQQLITFTENLARSRG